MFLVETPVPNPLDFLEPGAVALLVVVLLFFLSTGALAFVKGWVVPRFIYDKAVERGDKAVQILESQTEAIEELTKEVRFKGGR